jgi:hypothetical protein
MLNARATGWKAPSADSAVLTRAPRPGNQADRRVHDMQKFVLEQLTG